jgi:streptogramin lyase
MLRPTFPLALLVPALVSLLAPIASAQTSRTYTTSADFLEGTLTQVNLQVPDQLQLEPAVTGGRRPILNLPLSGRGTILRVDGITGESLGEYRTAPQGRATNPSRTAIDAAGNVWVGNRDEAGNVPGVGPRGSVLKIGVCVGGTRTNEFGVPDPLGLYLAPPYAYNTCVDRDGDGLIRTSRGVGDVFAWPDVTDGSGGADGIVQDALDEAILVYQRVHGLNVRHVSITATGDVWVGGFPFVSDDFDLLRGTDGAILQTLVDPMCGGHGGSTDPAGIVWSATGEGGTRLMRFDPAMQQVTCINLAGISPNNSGSNHGLAIGPDGSVWVTQFDLDQILRFDPAGNLFPGFPKPTFGSILDRSAVVSPFDGNVWVDGSAGQDVTRLDANGDFRKVIDLGSDGRSPRGMTVDATGKIWTVCTLSNTAKRIDPAGGADGLGAVDLTLDLGRGSRPYGFSDMASTVNLPGFEPVGTWQVRYDSGIPFNEYGRIAWTESVPGGSAILVEFRVADDPQALDGLPWATAQNGTAFNGVFGRFVDVRATFTRPSGSTATPVLFDLTIEGLAPPEPTSCPAGRRNPASLLLFPEFDSRAGCMSLLTVSNTSADFTELGSNFAGTVLVEFVYVGRSGANGQSIPCLEFNRTHLLTPNDTLTVIARAHNPDQEQGYMYAFAKDPLTGEAIVHDHLVGHALVTRALESADCAYNPFAFLGIGPARSETDHDGDGVRDLNGLEYTCVGDELLFPRFLGQDGLPGLANGYRSDLVLINLTGGTNFSTLVDLLVYNDAEEVFSASYGFECWDRRSLSEIDAVFTAQFLATTNHAPGEVLGVPGLEAGWFRVDGNLASSSAVFLPDPAVLGLLVERLPGSHAGSDLPFEEGAQTNGDLHLFGVLGDQTP